MLPLLKKVDLLSDLNEKQKEAVVYFDTNLRIIAGAGTGKTKVLTRKVSYLINDLGISPRAILAVTFTNKAAKEMVNRIEKYCQNNKEELNVMTFHSFCTSVLRKDVRAIGYRNDFYIIDEEDKIKLLKRIYDQLNITTNEVSYQSAIQYITWAKNFTNNPSQFSDELKKENDTILTEIFHAYLNELARQGSMDFDDLILTTHTLFQLRPDILKKYQDRYNYILVDEFQDTSSIQYEIIKMLVTDKTHLCIVGDPDQTIYNWRGADVNLILNFDKDFNDAKTVILDINYRSTQKILDAANKLIKYNKKRFSKDLVTLQKENEEQNSEIQYFNSFNEEAEARYVVNKINELKKNKNQLKTIAILFRTNYYSRAFEQVLIEENIPHKIINGTKFYQRSEIKDVIAFLRVLWDGHEISFERIVNVPNRGLGEKTLNAIRSFSKEVGKSLYNTMKQEIKKLPVPKEVIINKIHPFIKSINDHSNSLRSGKYTITRVLDSLLNELKYYESIENNKNLRGTAKDNVKELLSSIDIWQKKNKNKSVDDYLNMVNLMTVTDELYTETNYVTLMTIHSAKGLEYDNLFLVGMNQEIFPSYRIFEKNAFLNSRGDSNTEDLLEEERRLAYVAITRAKRNLYITSARGYHHTTKKPKHPSQFLEEMGINLSETILLKTNENMSPLTPDDDVTENITKNSQMIVGDIISHVIFGEGEVIEINGNNDVLIKFHKNGETKRLNKLHHAIRIISR
ncbi:ATP-dependent helicase [Mycoplasma leonicaptivi]|uniref:ATP-dependent helicase n=1 Tax=Mycoplasma leonicaptivi TaxID=36742 RepID=UPI00055AA232|nr:UvrD-helicase domain-containing protein [Mycoplasma leonicaptivi]